MISHLGFLRIVFWDSMGVMTKGIPTNETKMQLYWQRNYLSWEHPSTKMHCFISLLLIISKQYLSTVFYINPNDYQNLQNLREFDINWRKLPFCYNGLY